MILSGLSAYGSHQLMESTVTCIQTGSSTLPTVTGGAILLSLVFIWCLFSGVRNTLFLGRMVAISTVSVLAHRVAVSMFYEKCGGELGGSIYFQVLSLVTLFLFLLWSLSGKSLPEFMDWIAAGVEALTGKGKEKAQSKWLEMKEKRLERKKLKSENFGERLEMVANENPISKINPAKEAE